MIYRFEGRCGRESTCDIHVRRMADPRDPSILVIAEERGDNPGPPIAESAAIIATSLCNDFGISPHDLVWLELSNRSTGAHLGTGGGWSRVSFGFDWSRAVFTLPVRRPLSREQAEAMVEGTYAAALPESFTARSRRPPRLIFTKAVRPRPWSGGSNGAV